MAGNKEDAIERADAFLSRFRDAPSMSLTDEFPVLTDVVEEASDSPQSVQPHADDLDNAKVSITQPVDHHSHQQQGAPDIRALVERAVLRCLEEALPELAAEAGRIAQETLQANFRLTGGSSPLREEQSVDAESQTQTSEPPPV